MHQISVWLNQFFLRKKKTPTTFKPEPKNRCQIPKISPHCIAYTFCHQQVIRCQAPGFLIFFCFGNLLIFFWIPMPRELCTYLNWKHATWKWLATCGGSTIFSTLLSGSVYPKQLDHALYSSHHQPRCLPVGCVCPGEPLALHRLNPRCLEAMKVAAAESTKGRCEAFVFLFDRSTMKDLRVYALGSQVRQVEGPLGPFTLAATHQVLLSSSAVFSPFLWPSSFSLKPLRLFWPSRRLLALSASSALPFLVAAAFVLHTLLGASCDRVFLFTRILGNETNGDVWDKPGWYLWRVAKRYVKGHGWFWRMPKKALMFFMGSEFQLRHFVMSDCKCYQHF